MSPDEPNPLIAQFQAELYFEADCALAEGPLWNDGTLFWTDITGKAIYAKRDSSGTAEKYELPFEVGTLALWQEDSLVLGTEEGFQSFNLRTREIEAWANPEKEIPTNRFNDGKCDPRGRFVAGTISRVRKPEASLYLLDHDRSVRKIHSPVTNSNGLAWSADGETFYYIDTPTRAVRAFNYNLAAGELSNERIIIRIPESHGKPDGMTIDRGGNLWIGLWEGSGIECWNPNTGRQCARIDVPAARITSCAFGGKNYETLFITSAKADAKNAEKRDLGGSIFRANPNARGFPAVRFAGK